MLLVKGLEKGAWREQKRDKKPKRRGKKKKKNHHERGKNGGRGLR